MYISLATCSQQHFMEAQFWDGRPVLIPCYFRRFVVAYTMIENGILSPQGLCRGSFYQCYHRLMHLPQVDWWEPGQLGTSLVINTHILPLCLSSNYKPFVDTRIWNDSTFDKSWEKMVERIRHFYSFLVLYSRFGLWGLQNVSAFRVLICAALFFLLMLIFFTSSFSFHSCIPRTSGKWHVLIHEENLLRPIINFPILTLQVQNPASELGRLTLILKSTR